MIAATGDVPVIPAVIILTVDKRDLAAEKKTRPVYPVCPARHEQLRAAAHDRTMQAMRNIQKKAEQSGV